MARIGFRVCVLIRNSSSGLKIDACSPERLADSIAIATAMSVAVTVFITSGAKEELSTRDVI